MASAQVVETSVTNNSPSHDSNHPDDPFQLRYVTPGFKLFFYNYCVDYEWYGLDPEAPPPPDDDLSTVEVNDVSLDVPGQVVNRFTNEVDPMEHSSASFKEELPFLKTCWARKILFEFLI